MGQQLLLIEQGLQALMKFALEDLGQVPDQLLEVHQLAPGALQVLLAGRELSSGDLQFQAVLMQGAAQAIIQWLRSCLWPGRFSRHKAAGDDG